MDGPTAFMLTLPAHPDSLTCVRHVLEGLADQWPVSRAELDDIQIATIEACTNVVLHAYHDLPTGLLEVRAGMEDGRPVVAVRDHGAGIVPRADSVGLGVGLSLIGALTEGLRIGRADDGAHEVRMSFHPPES